MASRSAVDRLGHAEAGLSPDDGHPGRLELAPQSLRATGKDARRRRNLLRKHETPTDWWGVRRLNKAC
ncbi:hypothetical protein JCM10369A_18090 [Nocardioides pyridinolyticus]